MNRRREQRQRREGGPVLTQLVEGQPIIVDDRELVPLVRVARWSRRQVHLQGDKIGSEAYGLVSMKPVGIVERDHSDVRHHAIHDVTARKIGWLLLTALLIPLFTTLIVRIWRTVLADGPPAPAA